ncbi:MAG: LrgB family protein [Clostridia bacterium]
MIDILQASSVFGLLLTIVAYKVGEFASRKLKISILSPFLATVLIVIAFLLVFDIDYEVYEKGASYLTYLLTPATICLAISLYEQIELLKNNLKAIVISVTAGAISSMICVYIMSRLFQLDYSTYLTILPKSITTAIALGVAEEYGCQVTIMILAIMVTGVTGNSLAVLICKLAKIKNPISRGLAIGTSSHGVGTAKAIEMGEIEGAMSGLAIVISGIATVAFISFFVMLY